MNLTSPVSFVAKNLTSLSRTVAKNSPTILTVLGVTGTITTVITGIRATPKALERLEEARWPKLEQGGYGDSDVSYQTASFEKGPLTEWERFVAVAPAYIPTAILGGLTITSIIYANKINLRRQAVLFSAYTLADNRSKEWQEKVVELFGEKKAEKVQDEIQREHMEANPASKQQVILTGTGEVLMFDDFSGRYFRSTADRVKRVIAEMNFQLTEDHFVPANDYYWELGLEQVGMGDQLGWRFEDAPIAASFSTHMSDLGEPCISVGFNIAPSQEFYA